MKQCQTGDGHACVVQNGCGVLTLSMNGDGGNDDDVPRGSTSSSSRLCRELFNPDPFKY